MRMLSRISRKSIFILGAACALLSACITDSEPESQVDSVAEQAGDSKSTFDIKLTATDGEHVVQVEFTPDARHMLEAVDTSRADGAPTKQIDKERITRMLQERLADLPVGTVSRVIVTESFDKPEWAPEGTQAISAPPLSAGCLIITGSAYFYTIVYNANTPSQYCRSAVDYFSNATFNTCTNRLVDIGTYCCSTLSEPYAC